MSTGAALLLFACCRLLAGPHPFANLTAFCLGPLAFSSVTRECHFACRRSSDSLQAAVAATATCVCIPSAARRHITIRRGNVLIRGKRPGSVCVKLLRLIAECSSTATWQQFVPSLPQYLHCVWSEGGEMMYLANGKPKACTVGLRCSSQYVSLGAAFAELLGDTDPGR